MGHFFSMHTFPPNPHLDDVIYEQANEVTIKVYFASHNPTLGPIFWSWCRFLCLLGCWFDYLDEVICECPLKTSSKNYGSFPLN